MDKITRLLAFGDFHANPLGEFSRTLDKGGSSVLSKVLIDTTNWIVTQVKNQKAEVLLNNGDFSHTPGVLNAPTIKLISDIEQRFSGIPRIYNIGNHDLDGKVGLHNLSINSHIPGVVAIPEPSSVCWYGGIAILPFTYSAEEQESLLEAIPDGSVVVIHAPIKGIFMGNGVIESHGIDPKVLERFRLVIASHYHQPQLIIDGEIHLVEGGLTLPDLPFGAVVEMGTPCARSFNDQGKAYGIWSFVLGDKIKCKFLSNPYSPSYVNLNVSSVDEFKQKFVPENNKFYSVTGPKEVVESVLATNLPEFSSVRFRKEKREVASTVRDSSITTSSNLSVKEMIKRYAISLGEDFLEPKKLDAFLSPLIDSIGDSGQSVTLGGNIKFLSLEVRNFLSWKKASVSFDGFGLTLISGVNLDTTTANSNGSGKSSLLEAMVWALYDTTFREVPNKDSVARKGADSCLSTVQFMIGEDKFEVTRERNKGKGSITVLKNDTDISRGSANAVNAQIISILGIPYEVFSMITLFGSSNPNRFTSLGDADRKKFLGTVFNLGIYEILRSKVKEISSSCQKSKLSCESKVQTIKETISSILLKLEEEKTLSVRREESRKERIKELESEIKKAESAIKATEKQISNLSEKIEKETEELVKLKSNNLFTLLREKDSRVRDSKEKIATLERKLQRAARECEEKQSEIENFVSTCPTCGQPIPQDRISGVLIKYSEELEKLQSQHDEVVDEIENYKELLSNVEVEITSIKNSLSEVEGKVAKMENEVNEKKSSKRTLELELGASRKQLNQSGLTLSGLKTQDYLEPIRVLSNSLKEEEDRKVKEENNLAMVTNDYSFASRVYDLLGPREIISYILDTGIKELNLYLESVSSGIFGDDYTISLSSTKELSSGQEENRISIQYSTQAGSYGASSDGEKRKADIAIFLALNCLASALGVGSTNLMIADEALDSLDFTAAKCVVDTISKFAEEESKRVFLISHSDNIVPFVSDVLWVEKKDGISRIRN